MNRAYQNYRARNNAASRRSRAAAKATRADPDWVTFHPELSERERQAVTAFLAGRSPKLSALACDLLRKHLVAARTTAREHYSALIARLDRLTPS